MHHIYQKKECASMSVIAVHVSQRNPGLPLVPKTKGNPAMAAHTVAFDADRLLRPELGGGQVPQLLRPELGGGQVPTAFEA